MPRHVVFLLCVTTPVLAAADCPTKDAVTVVMDAVPDTEPEAESVGGFAAFLSGISESLGDAKAAFDLIVEYVQFERPTLEDVIEESRTTGALAAEALAHVERPTWEEIEDDLGEAMSAAADYAADTGKHVDVQAAEEHAARAGSLVANYVGEAPDNGRRALAESAQTLELIAEAGNEPSARDVIESNVEALRRLYAYGTYPYREGSELYAAGQESVSQLGSTP